MNLHNVKSLKRYSCVALATVLLFTSLSSVAQTLPEKDFLTRDVGNGVYELAVDSQQNALFAASSPSFEKDKTSGLIYKLDLEKLTTTEVIETSRRAFATAPMKKIRCCMSATHWKVRSRLSIPAAGKSWRYCN